MQPYDVALKELFRGSATRLLPRLAGAAPVEWLDVELPATRNPRVDLLARLEDGRLLHLELQTNNEADFGRRMAEYYVALHRQFDEEVEQIALYIGRAALGMAAEWRTRAMLFRYRLIDMREVDGEPLLASEDIGDNLLAVLTGADKERFSGGYWGGWGNWKGRGRTPQNSSS